MMALLPALSILLIATGFYAFRYFSRVTVGRNGTNLKVSVIIPARNEAQSLPKLLQSLAGQSFSPLEVIVVDDESVDETASIAKSLGATVISSNPLPEGWRGKTWACHQGALAARGDVFLFLDADTWFEPDGFKALMSHYDGSALSVAPYHCVGDQVHEDLSLFFNLTMMAGTLPDGLFGQCLMVPKTGYFMAGGHQGVRGKILENFVMAGQLRQHGIGVCSIPGKGILSFRMYPGPFSDLVEGWTKAFASGAGKTHPLVMASVITWMSGLMMGFLGLLFSDMALKWGPVYLIGVTSVGYFANLAGRFRLITPLLYPIPLLVFFVLFTRSAMKGSRSVTWKGRTIHES